MKRTTLSDAAGPIVVAVAAIAVAAGCWIAADSMESQATPKPTPTVTVTVTPEQAIAEDDGPQDGSADCWDAWLCAKVAEGYKALDVEVDGHQGCAVKEGDTSLVVCPDGYETTS